MIFDTVIDNPGIRVLRSRGERPKTLSLLQHIYVEQGTIDDWRALQELHYKGHSLAAGSRFMRCVFDDGTGDPMLIGVMVFANPRPLDRDRMRIFPHTKPNQAGGRDTTLMNKMRMDWVNSNITWNNRTVLDTMYRSAGIAYRFKGLAYRMYCSKYQFGYVESRSSMGKFNPFSLKCGMKFTQPTSANALGAGAEFFAAHFESPPQDTVAVMEELAAMPENRRAFAERALREFYYKHSSQEKSGDKRDLGMTRVNALSIEYVIKQIQQLVLGSTVYWIWRNPDARYSPKGVIEGCAQLPPRLPLLAFDNQAVDAPFDFEALKGL